MTRPCARSALIAGLLAVPAVAHEIPVEVVVRMMARAEAETFQVVVRVPLRSMRDIDVPEFGAGYLDIEALSPRLDDIANQWIVPFVKIHENGEPTGMPSVAATQVALPSDRSLESFEKVLGHFAAPKPGNDMRLVWEQVLFDVLLEYPIDSHAAEFSLHSRLAHLASKVVTTLRFELPGGSVRAYQFTGDPGVVHLDPNWPQSVWRFVQLGFAHILDGPDHLLFLACLVIPLRRVRPLILIVSAFTVAHSVTLLGSAFGLVPAVSWFPPLVEVLIAVSVLYMALENIVGTASRRWAYALVFGLVHGFGFSWAVRETLQFAGSHLLTALLSFNVGVELGQIGVLLLLVPVLECLFRYVTAERVGTIILSALAAHQAWHWTLERAEVLALFQAGPGGSVPGSWQQPLSLAGGAVLAGIAWWLAIIARRRDAAAARPQPSVPSAATLLED